jgi:phage FluMu gp28-like protein
VEGVLFTGQAKLHMASVAKQGFEDRKVRLPLGDPAIRADLHSLRKVTTPAGNARFDVGGEGDGHADRAWAAFLGIYAASAGKQPAAGASSDPTAETYRAADRKTAGAGRFDSPYLPQQAADRSTLRRLIGALGG